MNNFCLSDFSNNDDNNEENLDDSDYPNLLHERLDVFFLFILLNAYTKNI